MPTINMFYGILVMMHFRDIDHHQSPRVPVFDTQRGNNRQSCFYADKDDQIYLNWLGGYVDMPIQTLRG
jgi:hypothetical protein